MDAELLMAMKFTVLLFLTVGCGEPSVVLSDKSPSSDLRSGRRQVTLPRPFHALPRYKAPVVPPPDNVTGSAPESFGVFLGSNRFAIGVTKINEMPGETPSTVYYVDPVTFDAREVGRDLLIVAAGDLDKDGLVDHVYRDGVRWGEVGGTNGAIERWSNSVFLSHVVDVSSKGDLLSSRPCGAAPRRAFLMAVRDGRQFRDATDFVDDLSLNVFAFSRVDFGNGHETIVAHGWSCEGNMRGRTPLFFSLDGGTWKGFYPGGVSTSEIRPMGGAYINDRLYFTTHPNRENVEAIKTVRFTQGAWVFEDLYDSTYATNPEVPMIPWQIALVDLDADGFDDLVITHGADYISAETRAIGPEKVIALRNRGDGTFDQFTNMGALDTPGDVGFGWRSIAVSRIGGRIVIIVGGYGQSALVVYQP